MKVSVVIPNYNGEKLLTEHLPKVIKAKSNPNNKIIEIIIVDDCSNDDSVKLIRRNYSIVKLIKHKKNRGFSAAVNTGVRSSKGDLVVLLNSDVSPKENFLVGIERHFKDKRVFGVSLHEKGYGYARGEFKDGFIEHRPGRANKKTQVTFWVSGGSGVFRRSDWVKLGGFDESLFKFYWEDVDLSYRAQKRGFRVLWDPNAKVSHKHESSTRKTFNNKKLRKMQEKHQLLFIWKNLTSNNMFRKHLKGLLGRLIRHPGYIKTVIGALTQLRKVLKKRKKEIKECKVSDETIFANFKR